jgi:arylsulfatase A-like enzyme/Tfp pilus assembly protein PilF
MAGTILVVIAIGLAWVGRASDHVEVSAAATHGVRTIVLLTIDTWRRDATGFLGGPAPSPTPFLDDLARDGMVVGDAMTPVPSTGPSHWSMLSGRWPWRDGLHVNGDTPAPDGRSRLPQTLSRAGWRTGAFVSCAVLDRRLGFSEGFSHYDDAHLATDGEVRMAERRGSETVDAAIRWITDETTADDRVFLWVHLFDPHYPYDPPEVVVPGLADDYHAEVAYADHQARRLAQALAKVGRPLDRSLWIALADHGEALGEHGERSHGILLHGVTTRIPFLVHGPGIPVTRYDALASTIDVSPTILDYVGLPAEHLDGLSLLASNRPASRAIPLESLMGARSYGISEVVGLRKDQWLWESSPRDHLWDVVADPDETTDLAKEHTDVVERLEALREPSHETETRPSPTIDSTMSRRLQSLGYVSGNMAAGSQDAREFAQVGLQWSAEIYSHIGRGELAQADDVIRKFLQKYPRSPDMWSRAGQVSVELGDQVEAEARFRRSLELDPANTSARVTLAVLLYRDGRKTDAEATFKQALDYGPEDNLVLWNYGAFLAQEERLDEAAVYWKRFVHRYPEDSRSALIRAQFPDWD